MFANCAQELFLHAGCQQLDEWQRESWIRCAPDEEDGRLRLEAGEAGCHRGQSCVKRPSFADSQE